jgi:hypothetical protein
MVYSPNYLFRYFLIIINFIVAGCANYKVDQNYSMFDNDSIIIIGVESKTKFYIDRGQSVSGWYYPSTKFLFLVEPEDEYVIVKLPATKGNEKYSIVNLTGGLSADRGREIIVFEASPGKALYIGTVNLIKDGNSYKLEAKFENDKAKNYINKNYKNLIQRYHDNKFSILRYY